MRKSELNRVSVAEMKPIEGQSMSSEMLFRREELQVWLLKIRDPSGAIAKF
jgi:hypothetical protein